MESLQVSKEVETAIEPAKVGLIKAYGLFWSVAELRAARYRLYGESGDKRVADFREQNGLYVLYGPKGVRNIGIATEKSLASRLKTHDLKDRHKGLWNRFSWFGFRDAIRIPNRSGWSVLEPTVTEDLLAAMRPKHAIKDIEALLIFVQSKDENRNPLQLRPKFRAAKLWQQISAMKIDVKVKSARLVTDEAVPPFAIGDLVITKHGLGVIVGNWGRGKFRIREERDGQERLVSVHSLLRQS